MNNIKKNLIQINNAKAGIELFYNNTINLTSYEDLNEEIKKLSKYILRTAKEENNRPNKNITAIIEYFNGECKNKRNITEIVKKSNSKKLTHKTTYKDYIKEYYILKERGHSLRDISEYSEKYFKTKVSKSTLSKVFKEKEESTKC